MKVKLAIWKNKTLRVFALTKIPLFYQLDFKKVYATKDDTVMYLKQ